MSNEAHPHNDHRESSGLPPAPQWEKMEADVAHEMKGKEAPLVADVERFYTENRAAYDKVMQENAGDPDADQSVQAAAIRAGFTMPKSKEKKPEYRNPFAGDPTAF